MRALVGDEDVDVVANILIEEVPGPLPLCPLFFAEIRDIAIFRNLFVIIVRVAVVLRDIERDVGQPSCVIGAPSAQWPGVSPHRPRPHSDPGRCRWP